MNFKQIKNTETEIFLSAMDIYTDSFPHNERHSISVIKNRVNTGQEMLYGLFDSEELIGIALIWDLQYNRYLLLDYLAIVEKRRNSGAGKYFVSQLIEQFEQNNIIIEVEKPNSVTNDIKSRRIKFYKQAGFRQIIDYIYTMPSIEDKPIEKMYLMLANYNGTAISGTELYKVVSEIYKQVYLVDDITIFKSEIVKKNYELS